MVVVGFVQDEAVVLVVLDWVVGVYSEVLGFRFVLVGLLFLQLAVRFVLQAFSFFLFFLLCSL